MIYIVWVLLGVLAFTKKNNKYVTALIFLFITVVFCFNTTNPDYESYRGIYRGFHPGTTEPIFIFLNDLFYNVGISYEMFRGGLSILSLALITSTFYKLTPYPSLALFMYSIYPMSIDVVQIRYTVAYSIAFFSFRFLVEYQNSHKKREALFFFLGIGIATGFHYAAILYAMLGLLVLDIRKHRFIYLVLIPAAVVVGISMLDKLAPIIGSIIGMNKTTSWVLNKRGSSILKVCYVLVSRALPMLLAIFFSFISKNNNFREIRGGKGESIGIIGPSSFLYESEKDPKHYYDPKTNACLFLSMLYIYSFSILEITISYSYERIARLGLLFGGALLTRQLSYLEKANKLISSALLLMMQIVYFALVIFVFEYFDFVFRAVMENNSFFQMFLH